MRPSSISWSDYFCHLKRTEDQPSPVTGIAFTTNFEDETVKRFEADVILMTKSFNNMVKKLD